MGIIPQRYDKPRFDFAQIQAPLETFFLNTTAGTGSTVSGTFVDYPGPREKIIVKREPATALFVSGFVGAFVSGVAGTVFIGIRINSVDYLVGQHFFNTANVHTIIPFNAPIASGLVASTYTARLRWRTNTAVSANPDDVVHIRFDEGHFS